MFDAIKESRITNKRKPLNKNHNTHTHTLTQKENTNLKRDIKKTHASRKNNTK